MGHEVRMGRDCVLYHGVTLGHDGNRDGQPVLGDRVRVYAGARLLGPITVGDDAVIAAGALVLDDVPSRSTAIGAPARVNPRITRTAET